MLHTCFHRDRDTRIPDLAFTYRILLLPRLYVEWQNRGGRGKTISIYCAILVAKHNEGGGAIKEVLNAKNSTD